MLNTSGRILGKILYVSGNPALCKPIGLALSILTWQVHVTCFQDTNADSVVRVVSTLHSQQLLFITDSIRGDMDASLRFFGKIQIRVSESKNGFPIPNPDFRFQKRILSFFGQIQKRIMNP